MVRRQIAGGGIDDAKVLEAMRKVHRHRLVPESVRYAAYADTPLGIGYNQTISQPFMVGLMTEALDLEPDDKVLEIGTGSGYQAAVLGEICKEVYTIEIVEPLARRARKDLDALGYRNIHTRVGDGYFGWKEKAPFDGIIVTAAAGHVPPPLIEQLKEGGKIVIPLGNPLRYQTLTILEKKGDNVEATYSTQCRFVPMTGKMEEK
jgi:protein-L-isoaspartate(D-aspartate) O-methyltransferase